MARKQPSLLYRQYEIPRNSHVLPLFAIEWLTLQKHGDPLHFHNLLEIGICLDGQGVLSYGNTELPYHEGTIISAPANFPHATFAEPSVRNLWEYILIDVDGFLKEAYPHDSDTPWKLAVRINSGSLYLQENDNPAITKLVREILDVCRRQEELYLETQRGLVLALLVELAKANKQRAETGANVKAVSNTLYSALEFIGAHYAEKIRISELAELCHLSESHFRRLFVECMNMSPVSFINETRIKAACQMLSATGEVVGEVAMKCGFPSLSTFNRTFRDFEGTSPSEWRSLLPKDRPFTHFFDTRL